MVLLRYLQKAEKSVTEHFQEVSNNQNSNPGLSKVESESVAETLKHVTAGK